MRYRRCDECGAPEGLVCRDMDDQPATEVCEGRRLAIAPPEPLRPVVPHTCPTCRAPLVVHGPNEWCPRLECRNRRKADALRAKRARARALLPPVQDRQCLRCDVTYTPVRTTQEYCSETCRSTMKSRRARAAKKETRHE